MLETKRTASTEKEKVRVRACKVHTRTYLYNSTYTHVHTHTHTPASEDKMCIASEFVRREDKLRWPRVRLRSNCPVLYQRSI